LNRRHHNKRFSIVAVAEGALSIEEAEEKASGNGKKKKGDAFVKKDGVRLIQEPKASRIAREIQQLSGIEARVTSLGHIQRGGIPSPTDRLLCTRLGTKAGELLAEGTYNVMVGVKGQDCEAVPLDKVAGITRVIPKDHPWIETARLVDTCMGD
ncbi:MAG TPA: 6-phosphofructokinase, partial [Tichowtungia sp.]|nr:6-phosphofructokinase [Tichowtungia sp.]